MPSTMAVKNFMIARVHGFAGVGIIDVRVLNVVKFLRSVRCFDKRSPADLQLIFAAIQRDFQVGLCVGLEGF
jgi:hypothetical protein